MKPIHALRRIDEMRPTKFNAQKSYLVRIAPHSPVQNFHLPGNVVRLRKGRGWTKYDGRKTAILADLTERGYTKRAAYSRGKRLLRPLCDIARNPKDADEIERLYDIDARQALPGTAERPNMGGAQLKQTSEYAKDALDRLSQMTQGEYTTSEFGNSDLVDSSGEWEDSSFETTPEDLVFNSPVTEREPDPPSKVYSDEELAKRLGIIPAVETESKKPKRPSQKTRKQINPEAMLADPKS